MSRGRLRQRRARPYGHEHARFRQKISAFHPVPPTSFIVDQPQRLRRPAFASTSRLRHNSDRDGGNPLPPAGRGWPVSDRAAPRRYAITVDSAPCRSSSRRRTVRRNRPGHGLELCETAAHHSAAEPAMPCTDRPAGYATEPWPARRGTGMRAGSPRGCEHGMPVPSPWPCWWKCSGRAQPPQHMGAEADSIRPTRFLGHGNALGIARRQDGRRQDDSARMCRAPRSAHA